MDEHHLEQAREVVSGRRVVDVGEVGEIPQTGLAVIGHYVRRHGFLADLLPSPYGGVRAVVLVPSEVVETLEVLDPAPPPAPAPAAPAARREPAPDVRPAEGDLPKRRSKRDETPPAAAAQPEPPTPEPPTTETTPEEAGAWMAAFFDNDADTQPGDDER